MNDTQRPDEGAPPSNFIRDLVVEDRQAGKHGGRVATRFPPEPNGYLHIGHAKAICLDFGVAREFGGTCNLRFDDTNPTTEETEFVDAIQADVRWLGFEPSAVFFASDYFEELYRIAERLIEQGDAYVDSLSEEQIREHRGNYYIAGRPSPYRDRPVAESLDLLRRMRAGEFPDGAHVVRAKIDFNSPNMNLRDPLLYRIRHAPHHRTGATWCIYPMYDYAHPLSDAIEQITHSICTLEFEAHRPLYDWCIEKAGVFRSRQLEFARLNLTYTVMSKRKLAEMVREGVVRGWDDPRMPTLAGLRRRGYTPEAIRAFCERIGVAKADSTVDVGLLEYYVREDLNRRSPRLNAVLRPLKVVITNFPEGEVRELDCPLHPEDPAAGSRKVPFTRTLLVERDDFREEAVKQWYRLAPGKEVRLRYACLLTCDEVVKDDQGQVVELRCTMDPGSWGGNAPDGRTVKGTLHWVSAERSIPLEARLYDRLFRVEEPGTTEGVSFLDEVNPDSLVTVEGRGEPWLANVKPGDGVQFERLAYFCVDPDSRPGRPVFNRTVTLRDSWAKLEAKLTGKQEAKPAPAPKPAKEPKKPKEKAKAPEPAAEVGIEDFQKLDLRVGVVKVAEVVPQADKLLRLEVDLGDGRPRQVFSGIRASYPDPGVLVGKRVAVLVNLKPRQMKFGLSEGMVLAAGGAEGVRVCTFDEGAGPGDRVT
ncbi:MAG: glutamine--tRNA ligase/YqeY domain fusion protein [Planctomycetota bacterium]|nr:glutamine--tRNA ligase/YqeY domain fusion protein [Planctomycetota bacterium]